MNKKIFLICPVRNATEEQINKMNEYISMIESGGDIIFYPARDNFYEMTDKIGYIICKENARAIFDADEIHIFWDNKSSGSLFDLGVAFGLGKPIKIVNADEVIETSEKSFANMITEWSKR